MSLRDDVLFVRDRSLTRLNAAHDYYTFTIGAWRTLEGIVDEGRRFSIDNAATGSRVDERQLLRLSHDYVADELASATLQQFVSIFENFLFDVLRLWLLAHPQSINKRQVTGEDVLALPDKAAIVDALVAKELAAVFYDRPANWFRYLNDRVAIGRPTAEQIQQFAEVKATRDVLVHGQGFATAPYADKAGPLARAPVGRPLDVPGPYHHDCWTLLCTPTDELGSALAEKA